MLQVKVVEHWILYKEVSRRICLYPCQSGVRGLQRLPYLKYFNVQKWESRFTLGLGAAKITHYIQKKLQIKAVKR